MLKQAKTLTRTKNTKFGKKYKAVRLSNAKKNNLTSSSGPGAKQAWMRFAFKGTTADDGLRVKVHRIDAKKGKKNTKATKYWVVDLPGGNGTVYRDVWFQWNVPAPKKGWKRRMRVQAVATNEPVTVTKFLMKRWIG